MFRAGRSCCCPVSIGSRLLAGLAIAWATINLLSLAWNFAPFYYWIVDGVIFLVEVIAGVLVFYAVEEQNAVFMIPQVLATGFALVGDAVAFVFAIVAIANNESPLANNFRERYLWSKWFKDEIDSDGSGGIESFIHQLSITAAFLFFFWFLVGCWVLMVHIDNYLVLRQRDDGTLPYSRSHLKHPKKHTLASRFAYSKMGYRCCCCSVTVGSRLWAGFTIIAAFLALIGDIWSLSEWFLWMFSSIVLVVELIAGILVFMAVRRRQPRLMIPIMVISVLQGIFLIGYLGFAIWAIFDDSSPVAQNIIEMYKDLDWFQDMLQDFWYISVYDYITFFSIALSISIFICVLLNIWIFVTHYQTYKLITHRLLHCPHVVGVVPEVRVIPSSYPPPSSYPSPIAQPQGPPPYVSAAPAEVLTYPSLTTYSGPAAYGFDPAVGKVEQVKF